MVVQQIQEQRSHKVFFVILKVSFPSGSDDGKEPLLWCGRPGFDRSLVKIPLPREIHGQRSLAKVLHCSEKEIDTSWYVVSKETSLEKTPMLGEIEGKRRRGQQRMRWLDNITNSVDMHLSKHRDSGGQRSLACCSLWSCKELDMTLVTELTTKETSDGDSLEFELQQLNFKKAAFLEQEISFSLKIFFPSHLRRK